MDDIFNFDAEFGEVGELDPLSPRQALGALDVNFNGGMSPSGHNDGTAGQYHGESSQSGYSGCESSDPHATSPAFNAPGTYSSQHYGNHAGPSNSGFAGPSNSGFAGPSNSGFAGPSSFDFAGPSSYGFAGPSSYGFAGPSSSSASGQAVSSSPRGYTNTNPTDPSSPNGQDNPDSPYNASHPTSSAGNGEATNAEPPLNKQARRVYNRLPESIIKSMGWHPERNQMLNVNPHFIPTFDLESALNMTARDTVNKVGGLLPAAAPADDEGILALRALIPFDINNSTVEDMAEMGHKFLDVLIQQPKIAAIWSQYTYEPEVQAETLETILPDFVKHLHKEKGEEVLASYQLPYKEKNSEDVVPMDEDTDEDEDNEDNQDVEDDEDDDDDDDEDDEGQEAVTPRGNFTGRPLTKAERKKAKMFPRKVQYAPYRYMFKTGDAARAHRKKIRAPPKIAKDIDRVERYGRYYWTKRIYEAMINIDLMIDNQGSIIATNISQLHHFNEDDLEATAHHIFDAAIGIHRRGWHGYDYNRTSFKRGGSLDVFKDSIESRLERICGALKHSKAMVNDCMTGGDVLLQTVDNPAHRAKTKTANNRGNKERGARLAKQETEGQKEKRLAKEAAKEAAQRERAEAKAIKDAQTKAEKERKAAEREAERARKAAEREAEKERKAAEREAERMRKAAEKEAAAAARRKR